MPAHRIRALLIIACRLSGEDDWTEQSKREYVCGGGRERRKARGVPEAMTSERS